MLDRCCSQSSGTQTRGLQKEGKKAGRQMYQLEGGGRQAGGSQASAGGVLRDGPVAWPQGAVSTVLGQTPAVKHTFLFFILITLDEL